MTGEQKIYYLVANDEQPVFKVRFVDRDLTSYSTLKMVLRYQTGARLEKTIAVDPLDTELGLIAWSAGDLIPGKHSIEFCLDNQTVPRKFPVLLIVRRDLNG